MPLTKPSWQEIRGSSSVDELAMNLLREIAPAELSDQPLYIVELKHTVYRDVHCSGFAVSRDGVSWVRPELEKLGIWKGPGHAILTNLKCARDSVRYLSLIVHEAGHCLESAISDFPTPIPKQGASFSDRKISIDAINSWSDEEEAKPDTFIKNGPLTAKGGSESFRI